MGIRQKYIRGFTIVELLIVIVIIGILATVTAIVYSGIQASARDTSVLSDLDTMDGLQTSYSLKNGGNAKPYYSGDGPDSELGFTASGDNVIDVVTNGDEYCIRGYNVGGTKTTIDNAFTKESSSGVCATLAPSASAIAGSSNSNFVNVAWTERTGAGICCSSVALSSDGTKLAGIEDNSFFYSYDSGSTWSSTTPFANYTHNIASSADGSKLFVTTAYYEATPIYVSTNSGASWSTPASAYQMSHITASSDGSKIATGNYDALTVSTDTGSSWIDVNNGSDYPNGDYMAVDMSDNGSVLLASSGSSSPNYLYVSNNMGSNWTKLSSGPTSVFGSDDIAVSGNGSIFYVISRPDSGSNDNFVYKSSNNGVNWSQLTIPGANLPLVAVDTSSDGSVVVVASNNGYVYTSSNSGLSWTEQTSIGSRYWTDVAVSSDGSKIVAVADGIVYTGVYGP